MKELLEGVALITILALGVFGIRECSEPDKLDIRIAEYICEKHGGLYERNRIAIEHKVVVCNDGSRHDPSNVVIKK